MSMSHCLSHHNASNDQHFSRISISVRRGWMLLLPSRLAMICHGFETYERHPRQDIQILSVPRSSPSNEDFTTAPAPDFGSARHPAACAAWRRRSPMLSTTSPRCCWLPPRNKHPHYQSQVTSCIMVLERLCHTVSYLAGAINLKVYLDACQFRSRSMDKYLFQPSLH